MRSTRYRVRPEARAEWAAVEAWLALEVWPDKVGLQAPAAPCACATVTMVMSARLMRWENVQAATWPNAMQSTLPNHAVPRLRTLFAICKATALGIVSNARMSQGAQLDVMVKRVRDLATA